MSVSTVGIVAPLRGGIPGDHWTNAESLRSLSSRPSRASSHRDGGGGRSILRSRPGHLWLVALLLFFLAPLYTIQGVEWGVFIHLPLGALRGQVEFSADRASQRFQASVLRRTLLWDIFVCILWLHAVWHLSATVFALRKAVTAAAGSVAARVGGNDGPGGGRAELRDGCGCGGGEAAANTNSQPYAV